MLLRASGLPLVLSLCHSLLCSLQVALLASWPVALAKQRVMARGTIITLRRRLIGVVQAECGR